MAVKILMMLSAGIILLLGIMHLLFTFTGAKLTPRDPALQESMRSVSPVISKETTMWKAWLGFNASHSLGAILFGLIYGYLALWYSAFLFASYFLLFVGGGLLASFVLLGKLYWFHLPFRATLVAFAGYCTAVVLYFT